MTKVCHDLLMRAVCWVAIACGLASGQEAGPRFEVASVKASPEGPNAFSIKGGPGTSSPGQLTYTRVSLRDLLFMAYQPHAYELPTPEWMNQVYFDVSAKVPAGSTRGDVKLMLQKLLAERFQLQIHRESKLQPGYALRRGAGEPKLTPSPPLPADGPNLTPAGQVRFTRDENGFMVFPPGYTNVIGPTDSDGITRLTATRQSMKGLADYIARRLQKPVIDETEVDGIFDYHLAFAADSIIRNSRESVPVIENPDPAPTLSQAVERQLGLKLEPRKLPVDVIVIDHIERAPVEN